MMYGGTAYYILNGKGKKKSAKVPADKGTTAVMLVFSTILLIIAIAVILSI